MRGQFSMRSLMLAVAVAGGLAWSWRLPIDPIVWVALVVLIPTLALMARVIGRIYRESPGRQAWPIVLLILFTVVLAGSAMVLITYVAYDF